MLWARTSPSDSKRFDTIVDKLHRHPRMALTTMEDIGGVRVILDNQRQVDYIASQLQAQPKWKIRRVREYVEGRDPDPRRTATGLFMSWSSETTGTWRFSSAPDGRTRGRSPSRRTPDVCAQA